MTTSEVGGQRTKRDDQEDGSSSLTGSYSVPTGLPSTSLETLRGDDRVGRQEGRMGKSEDQ